MSRIAIILSLVNAVLAIISQYGIGPYQLLEATMWIRSVMLMFAVGCVAVGGTNTDNISDELSGPVSQSRTNNHGFQCQALLNVASCIGTISVFSPITVTVTKNDIVTNNDVNVLTKSLNDVAILDQDETDITKILTDVDVAAAAALGVLDSDVQSCNAGQCL